MTSNNHARERRLQQDARAWAAFTGAKYTAALRQITSPLAQGFLGEPVSARHLIATLEGHELVGADRGDPVLGEDGLYADVPWTFNGESDFIELALTVDMLRMFTPTATAATPEVSSYSLKHTAERFLSPHSSYVSNGRLIWAAAAMGLPLAEPEVASPNLLIGVPEREHDYLRRTVGDGVPPQAHHFRPPGYLHLQTALARCAAGDPVGERWVRPTVGQETAPFHDWLIQQAERGDAVGDAAGDYAISVRGSSHGIARSPDELLAILNEVHRSLEAYEAAVSAIAEWMMTSPTAKPVRTQLIRRHSEDVEGFGAGAGTTEWYEYRCPCGVGTITEEHDNIPGFREHDVRIDCDTCRAEWRFAGHRPVRGWGLQPIAVRRAI